MLLQICISFTIKVQNRDYTYFKGQSKMSFWMTTWKCNYGRLGQYFSTNVKLLANEMPGNKEPIF